MVHSVEVFRQVKKSVYVKLFIGTSQEVLVVKRHVTCLPTRCKRRGFSSWVGKIPGGGNGTPLQYSCLENSIDRGHSQAMAYGAAKSWTQLSTKLFIIVFIIVIMLVKIINNRRIYQCKIILIMLWGHPSWSSVWGSTWVQSLVWELESCMSCSVGKKEKIV